MNAPTTFPFNVARMAAEMTQLENMINAAFGRQAALRRQFRSNTWRNGLLADQAWLDLLTAMNAVDGMDDALSGHIDIAREEVERNDPEGILDGEAA